jgi:hypothetical protein
MSKRRHFRRVMPTRQDLRAEITARELLEEDLTTTRPIPVISLPYGKVYR